MTTLSVMVVTGKAWYGRSVGERYEVVKDGDCFFRVVGAPLLAIDKEHAVVTAVHYEEDENELLPSMQRTITRKGTG